jgi:hypothetical protein
MEPASVLAYSAINEPLLEEPTDPPNMGTDFLRGTVRAKTRCQTIT